MLSINHFKVKYYKTRVWLKNVMNEAEIQPALVPYSLILYPIVQWEQYYDYFLGNDWNQHYLDGFFVVVRKVLTRALFCFFKHEKTVLSSLVLHLLHLESADSGSSTDRLFINSTTVYVKLHDGKSIDWTNRLYNRTIYNLTNTPQNG